MRKLFLIAATLIGLLLFPQVILAAMTIDFSGTTGVALSADRVLIKNIRVDNEVPNPFDPSRPTVYSVYYDVPFRFDMATLHLIPDLSGAVSNTPERNCANLVVAVTDAYTGRFLAGASVTVGSANQFSASTDGNATFANLPSGVASITVSANGYENSTRTPLLACGSNSLGVALNPTTGSGALTASQVRIILNWGENPVDLDAHLTGPEPGLAVSSINDADRFHVYWSNQASADNVAVLDVDDTSSFGPETMTISPPSNQTVLRPGVYRYSVHHYEGSSTIAASGANVEVIAGSEHRSFTPPAGGVGVKDVWTAFELVVESGHITIRPVNTYQQGVSPSGTVRSRTDGVLPDVEDVRLYEGNK